MARKTDKKKFADQLLLNEKKNARPPTPLAPPAFDLLHCKTLGKFTRKIDGFDNSEMRSALIDLACYAVGLRQEIQVLGASAEVKRVPQEGA